VKSTGVSREQTDKKTDVWPFIVDQMFDPVAETRQICAPFNTLTMKQHYMKHTLLGAVLAMGITLNAQQLDKPRPAVASAPAVQTATTTIGDDGREHSVNTNPVASQGGGCDSLLAPFLMGNGNDGAMFDVVAVIGLKVTFFDVIMAGSGTGWAYVYSRPGSHVGYETSATGWTLIDSVQMNIPVTDSLYRVPVYVNQEILAGDTMAFYISGDGVNTAVDYTDGTAVGSVLSQDPGMKILEGTGLTYPFGNTFSPRNFNGIVNYCVTGIDPCQSTVTTYAGGNGNDGSMFDVTSQYDITVNGFSQNLIGTGTVRIYYHTGTHVGTEATPGAWTLIDSVNVTGATPGSPTAIPMTISLPVAAGSTVAFYITGDGNITVDYTDGSAVGNVFTADGIVEIKEGTGITYPFGTTYTPRIWNGTISYCLGVTGIESQEQNGASSTLYPNPVSGVSVLTLQTEQPLQNAVVVITDITGRVIESNIPVTGNQAQINSTAMTAGIYFYTVYEAGQPVTTAKFVVE
jgi:hypothetical protein